MPGFCPYCEQPIPAHVIIEMAEEVSGVIDDREVVVLDHTDEETVTMTDDETYECGAPLPSGGECSRTVDTPGARCFQHDDE